MNDAMTIGQLLTTPICWRPNGDVERERQAHQLLHRHERIVHQLRKEQLVLQRQLDRCVKRRQDTRLRRVSRRLAAVVHDLEVLERLHDKPTSEAARQVLLFSSMLLAESFRVCTETADEGMHFMAGIDVDGVAVATQLIRFPYAHRSWAAARGDQRATHRICIEIHEAGHRLLALLHSHPGSGPNANHHSGEDERTQRAFEQTTRMVGGIWSRDGYLRFFSARHPFKVSVAGNYVEQLNEMEFRLLPEAADLAL